MHIVFIHSIDGPRDTNICQDMDTPSKVIYVPRNSPHLEYSFHLGLGTCIYNQLHKWGSIKNSVYLRPQQTCTARRFRYIVHHYQYIYIQLPILCCAWRQNAPAEYLFYVMWYMLHAVLGNKYV